MFVYAGWKLSLSEMNNDGSSLAQNFFYGLFTTPDFPG